MEDGSGDSGVEIILFGCNLVNMERIHRYFEGKEQGIPGSPFDGKVKSTVALTRSVLSQFRDISIDSIMCNWAEGTSLI